LIKNIKKKLQSSFKFFSYGFFKIIYGKIDNYIKVGSDNQSRFEISKIEDLNYKVYFNKNARIYTDTVNDTAVIQKNKIIEGPSFQIRNVKFDSIEKNIVFRKGTPRLKKNIKNRLFSLLTGGAGNYNYWHWMFDVLPRFKILSNLIDIKEIDYFLFPNLGKKYQQETLDFLKIPKLKRLSSLKYRHISCKEIITTDHPYVIENNATEEIQNVPLWIVQWLRDIFLKEIKIDENTNLPKKIYIDRGDATSNQSQMRKIINDEEIKYKLNDIGIKSVKLGDLTFKKQIEIFNNADTIIGLHGGGFANLAFCKPGAKIIELKPSTAGMMYGNLSRKCKLNYSAVAKVPEKFKQNNQLGFIRVDFKEILNHL
tara:strand:+ start:644 stop:1750 length:1107 start_codon:yes stop_codon:yes gene_type:complete